MHPRIAELLQYLSEERAYLLGVLGRVPQALAVEKPAPESYSVSEVVQHLAITESRIAALLGRITAEARVNGATPDPELAPILPAIDVGKVVDRTTRVRNLRADPPGQKPLADAIADLDAARASLVNLLQDEGLPNLAAVSAPHPAFGPLTGYEWVAFVAAHTRRHAAQVEEVLATLQPR